jgi:hypothetical protein
MAVCSETWACTIRMASPSFSHSAWLRCPCLPAAAYPLPVLVVVTCALAAVVVIGQNIAAAPIVALPVYTVAARYERRVSVVALCAVVLIFLSPSGSAKSSVTRPPRS